MPEAGEGPSARADALPRDKAVLSEIDGLRGLAILAIIYQHGFSHGVARIFESYRVFPYLQGNGWQGVSLFFVLSGFVLARGFVGAQKTPPDSSDTRNYYLRRARRLLPLFIIGCFVGYLVNRASPESLLLALTTLSMFVPGEFSPRVNGPFWTLTLEIWFSALLPLILLSAWRFGYGRLLAGAIALALATRIVATQLTFPGLTIDPVKDSVPARIDDFVIGVVIAKLYVDGRLRNLPRWLPYCGAALVVLSALGWDLVLQGKAPAAARAFLNLPTAAGFACIVMSCLGEDSRVARFVRRWPLRVAGAMCFSIYCWHYWIMQATDPNSLVLRRMALFLLITLAVSLVSYKFIEFPDRPWRNLLRLDGRAAGRQSLPRSP
jgi:peptidoglycan/LPS O-acetylase OafA/YrhL